MCVCGCVCIDACTCTCIFKCHVILKYLPFDGSLLKPNITHTLHRMDIGSTHTCIVYTYTCTYLYVYKLFCCYYYYYYIDGIMVVLLVNRLRLY